MRPDARPSWPAGDGEMAGLIRSHDWDATPLGPIAAWPTSLRIATRLMLTTRHPMFIWWGPELIQLYNDPYRDTMGPEKHPTALGGRGQDTWEEVWGTIGPQIEQVMRGGPATWHEDHLVPVTRHGERRQVWWTYSYSPIEDDAAPNGVGGVLVICRDVTQEHIARTAALESEARHAILLALNDALRPLSDPIAIQDAAMRVLGTRMGVNRAFYGDAGNDNDTLVIGRGYSDGAFPLEGRVRFSDFGLEMMAWYGAGRTYVIEDAQRDVRFGARAKAGLDAIGVGAAVGVPLVKDGRVRAIVSLHQSVPRRWTATEIALLEETAERTWAAVERARAQSELRESEEQLRRTTQLVPAMLWTTDPAGRSVAADQRWRDQTGQREGEVGDFGWLDVVHPDDRVATRAAFEHAYATGEPIERQHRIRVGKEYRWHLVRHVPVRDEGGAVARWYGAAIDVHELHELQARQQVMVAELQHRTRNLITVVQSLSERTLDEAASLDDFSDRFEARLAALSRVQSLLSHLAAGERASFDELLRSQLAALGAPEGRVTLHGPAGVPLRSTTVQTFALALHELATNALKYGALSTAGGRLRVAWRVEPAVDGADPILHVDWRESEVAMSAAGAPARGGGYGRELIEEALPYQLKAKTAYVLGPDGVRCTIAVPVPAAPAAEGRPL